MSITFPLSAALVPYGIIVLYVLVFALLNLQHLFHYGTSHGTAKAAAWVWFLGTIAMIGCTFILLRDVDWSYRVTLNAPNYDTNATTDFMGGTGNIKQFGL
jgi:hypothetical protein